MRLPVRGTDHCCELGEIVVKYLKLKACGEPGTTEDTLPKAVGRRTTRRNATRAPDDYFQACAANQKTEQKPPLRNRSFAASLPDSGRRCSSGQALPGTA